MAPAWFTHCRGSAARSGERSRRWRIAPMTTFGAIAAMLLSGCSVLNMESGPPPDPTLTTSAAPVADLTAQQQAVTIPTLATGSTSADAPVPWQSRITTSAPPTTTAESTLTAPTTTRLSLTFQTVPTATKPTIAAPTAIGSPPPECYSAGTCPAQATAQVAGGTVEVLNVSGGKSTTIVLTKGGSGPTAMGIGRLANPTVDCRGRTCLIAGSRSGMYFGRFVAVSGDVLKSVKGTAASTTPLTLTSAGAPVAVGTHRFDGYGLAPADTPTASQTWAVSGGTLSATGCGKPYLYATPPAATGQQSGPCTGTPRVAGYGATSAHKMYQLGGLTTASGNIHCAVLPSGQLVCTAEEHQFTVAKCKNPPTPDGLKPKQGLRVALGESGSADYDNCLGYQLFGRGMPTIPYNRLAVGHGYVCDVTTERLRCENRSGHGFTLARAGITKF